MPDNFLVQQANGEWAEIRAIDVGGGVLVPQVNTDSGPGMPGVRAGTTIGPDIRAAAAATTAIAANTLYGHPLWVPETALFSGMVLSVGTAVPGVSGKMALCAGAPGGVNGALIEESPTILDMNSAANTVLTAAFAAPRLLQRGWYWPMSKFDGAAQPHTMNPGGIMGAGAVLMYGGLSLAAFVRSIGNTGTYYRASVADAYANDFPTLPALSFFASSPGVPIMGLVAAP
jgi:hypothetical protein